MEFFSTGPPDSGRRKPLAPFEWMLLLAGVALLAALPWTAEYWPSTDGPNHAANAHILSRYHDADTPYARYLSLEPGTTRSGYPLQPSNLQYVLLLLLGNFVSPPVAFKMLVSFTMIALPLSLALLLLRTVPERLRNVFFLLPLFSGWALGMGFTRYLLACIFGFLTVAIVSGARGGRDTGLWEPTWGRLLTAGALFYLSAWSHPFIAVLFGMTLMALEAGALRRGKGWRNLLVTTAPGAFLVVFFVLLGTPHAPPGGSRMEWLGPGDILYGFVGMHVGFSAMEYLPRGIAVLAMYFAALYGRRSRPRKTPPYETSLLRAVVLLHLLYLLLPDVMNDWHYCSARPLVMGAYMLPAVLVLPEGMKKRMGIALAGFLLTLSVFVIQYREAARLSGGIAEVVKVGGFIPRGSKVLPLCGYDTHLPNTFLHAWAYLVVSRDIVTPRHSAAGKPNTGGSRFRAIAYRPGVLDENGTMPWVDEYELRGGCAASLQRCGETVDRLLPVFRKYDRLLMVRPSRLLVSVARSKLTLERQEGDAFLFSMAR
ncbi:MAG: hypothetical protein JW793_01575 [Acidobacteria bacterium]|nr:hypothetical protein [Acidobacteriota bacterium]